MLVVWDLTLHRLIGDLIRVWQSLSIFYTYWDFAIIVDYLIIAVIVLLPSIIQLNWYNSSICVKKIGLVSYPNLTYLKLR